jgi:hypothetical protein
MTLKDKLTMLPGRVAVLTDAELPQESDIKVPDWVVAKMRNLGVPPHHLIAGEIVGVGYSSPQKGRAGIHPDDFKVGDRVAVMPLEGRIIHRNDPDHPDLGELIPEGKQLRLLGALQDVNEQVLIKL